MSHLLGSHFLFLLLCSCVCVIECLGVCMCASEVSSTCFLFGFALCAVLHVTSQVHAPFNVCLHVSCVNHTRQMCIRPADPILCLQWVTPPTPNPLPPLIFYPSMGNVLREWIYCSTGLLNGTMGVETD